MRSGSSRWAAGLLALGLAGSVRAQFTETALTVEPGAWLVEADLVDYTRQEVDGGTFRYWGIAYTQLTRGMAPRLDAQVAVHALQREEWQPARGLRAERADTALEMHFRAKWQVVEGGERGCSLALLPSVLVPLEADTEGRRRLEPGLIVPLSRALGDGWLDAQLQVQRAAEPGSGRAWCWLASTSLQRSWGERWGGYAELIADFGPDSWRHAAVLAGAGVTRTIGARGGWDAAVYRGVTVEAMDWELVLRVYWNL